MTASRRLWKLTTKFLHVLTGILAHSSSKIVSRSFRLDGHLALHLHLQFSPQVLYGVDYELTKISPIPSNLKDLETILEEEWAKIPVSTCRNLVVNFQRRLEAVIANKGYAIDY